MIRRTIQKHFYLLTSVALVLALCFLVGFGLMKFPAANSLPDIISTHQPYLLAWRLLVYATVIVYWPGLVDVIILGRKDKPPEKPSARIAHRRQPIILICLGFEFLIVQNIAGLLLAYGF